MQKSASHVVLDFVEVISRHDVKGFNALMTEDHVFVDGFGQTCAIGNEWRRAG